MSPRNAARLARWWTRAYTSLLPRDARDARRAEVESDIWEALADGDAGRDILPRLVLGAIDDVSWSVEHMDATARNSAWWSFGTLFTFAVAWLWMTRMPESDAMRESFWAFPIATTLHLLGVVGLVALRAIVDVRLTGRALRDVSVSRLVARLTPVTIIAAVVTVVSGLAMYSAEPAHFAENIVFRVKLVAVVLLLLNVWFMHAIALRRVREWDGTAVPPAAVRAAAYISLVLWACVIVAGRLTPFALFN